MRWGEIKMAKIFFTVVETMEMKVLLFFTKWNFFFEHNLNLRLCLQRGKFFYNSKHVFIFLSLFYIRWKAMCWCRMWGRAGNSISCVTGERSRASWPAAGVGCEGGLGTVRVYLVCQVKSHVPADRLLVWDVREGWGPLCKFLEVPVPNKPFPRWRKFFMIWEKDLFFNAKFWG